VATGAPQLGRAAARGRAARVAGYLRERFGPGDLAGAAVFSLAAQAGGASLARPGPLPVSSATLAGVAAGVLLALYLRVADDLKDWETDRRLAEAGDPRFRGRPQVTGGVTAPDLQRLKAGIAAVFGLLLALQPPVAVLLGGLSFLGAWLASRWFFYPAMARSLPLAFATHNPLALLFLSFAVAVGAGAAGATPPALPTAALLLGLYLPLAAWEIGRKVRTPEEETSYQTWSSVLGWRVAAIVPAVLSAGSAALLAAAGLSAGTGPGYVLLVAAAALLPAGAAVTFLLRPSPSHGGRLRPAVEGYALVAGLGLLLFTLMGT
jgi:4-hydroxybenzoate polyprenyltransferase